MSRKRRRTGGNPARPPAPDPHRSSPPPRPVTLPGGAYLGELQPPPGAGYLQTLRTPEYVLWRPIGGIFLAILLYLLLISVVSQVIIMLSWVVSSAGTSYAIYYRKAVGFEVPGGMLATNLAIACLIPITFVVIMFVHRVRPRWLGSVQPRLRWKYLLVSLGIAAVSFVVVLAASTLLTGQTQLRPQPQFWIFLIIILITSPLQAAGEEYLFRGYLLQAFGSMMRNPWFGIVASSVVFALFHGTQNLPLFIDRLAFGLLAALLVHRTGGIEAGIAAHAINNVYAFGLAGLTGTIAQARGLQEIGWANAAVDVGGFALFAVLAWLAGRVLKLRTTTP
jgi:membrane protease YdiL (CAAX protease family)